MEHLSGLLQERRDAFRGWVTPILKPVLEKSLIRNPRHPSPHKRKNHLILLTLQIRHIEICAAATNKNLIVIFLVNSHQFRFSNWGCWSFLMHINDDRRDWGLAAGAVDFYGAPIKALHFRATKTARCAVWMWRLAAWMTNCAQNRKLSLTFKFLPVNRVEPGVGSRPRAETWRRRKEKNPQAQRAAWNAAYWEHRSQISSPFDRHCIRRGSELIHIIITVLFLPQLIISALRFIYKSSIFRNFHDLNITLRTDL